MMMAEFEAMQAQYQFGASTARAWRAGLMSADDVIERMLGANVHRMAGFADVIAHWSPTHGNEFWRQLTRQYCVNQPSLQQPVRYS